MKSREICNECGRSVKSGSGLFIGRIPDADNYLTRKRNGKLFPEGGFICRECDEKIRENAKRIS